MKRLRARDERAFREFVEGHQRQVFNVVFRMLNSREEAEDVSQEVFVTVFKAIDSFRGQSRLSTWLYRIAANHAKNRLKYLSRRKSGHKQTLDDTPEYELQHNHPSSHPSPDSVAIGRQTEALLREALSRLDEDYRLVIVLRDVEHLSYEEISEIAGLTLGTVKSRLHRARAALRKAMTRAEKRRR